MSTVSSINDLQARRAQLQGWLADFKQQRRVNHSIFSQQLNALKNICTTMDVRHGNDELLTQRQKLLLVDLAALKDTALDQELRLKGDRIVPLQSRSMLRRLTGIGQAERKLQALALANRHHLGACVMTPRSLRDMARSIEQTAEGQYGRRQAFLVAMRPALTKVASVATFEQMTAEEIKRSVDPAFEEMQSGPSFEAAFKAFRAEITKRREAVKQQSIAPEKARLKAGIERAGNELRDAEHEARRTAELLILRRQLPADPRQIIAQRLHDAG